MYIRHPMLTRKTLVPIVFSCLAARRYQDDELRGVADSTISLQLLQTSFSEVRTAMQKGPSVTAAREVERGTMLDHAAVSLSQHHLPAGQKQTQVFLLRIPKTGSQTLRYKRPVCDSTVSSMKCIFQDDVRNTFAECETHPNFMFAFFVRAPLHRYVSGWVDRYHCGAGQECSTQNPRSPSEANSFRMFPTPDALGSALNASSAAIRHAAEEGMRRIGHENYVNGTWVAGCTLPPATSLSWLLGGIERLAKCKRSILFVGRLEHFEEDYAKLAQLLQADGAMSPAIHLDSLESMNRASDQLDNASFAHLEHLGSVAISNLRKWYAEDYKVIGYLAREGFLDATYPSEVDALDMHPW